MKLSLELVAEFNQIYSYDENQIVIRPKHQTGLEFFKAGFLLSPDQILTGYQSMDVEQLQATELAMLQKMTPEIIIFMTEKSLTSQMQQSAAPLLNANIGVEFMTRGSACRTFNLLVSELRNVLLVVNANDSQ